MVSLNSLLHENARLMFRNFAGRAELYNEKGDRGFVIFLEPEKAEAMAAEGWNIKRLKTREEGEVPQAYLPVAVSYKKKPPKIVVITSRARTDFGEDDLDMLDYAELKNADIMLSPSFWTMHEGTPRETKGLKAYLKSAFLTLNEDPLELKYAEDPTNQTPTLVSNSTASEES